MPYIIGITGKGGTGKTTLSGLIVQGLIAAGRRPVLAVDADPNSCLDMVLGVKVEKSVGTVREEARQLAAQGKTGGVSKQEFLEMKIAQCLVEGADFDLIAMGRSEGPGCYCYANNVLKDVIGRLSGAYPYIVMDNEAGLENLSRRIVQNLDVMIMVTDASRQGIETVLRLHMLAAEMGIQYPKLAVIFNRLRSESLPEAAGIIRERTGAAYIAGIADNPELAACAEQGRGILDLSPSNSAVAAINALVASVL